MSKKKSLKNDNFLILVVEDCKYNKISNAVDYLAGVYETDDKEYAQYQNRFSLRKEVEQKKKQFDKSTTPELVAKMSDDEKAAAYKLRQELESLNEIKRKFDNPIHLFPKCIQKLEGRVELGDSVFSEIDAVELAYQDINGNPLYEDWEDC